jgi:tricorn protease interacting factor F2/3
MNDFPDLHYRLHIEPDLMQFTFKGHVEIRFQPAVALDKLRLNCLGLDIEDCQVQGNDRPVAAEFELAEADEQLLINLSEPVMGPLTITIDYHGPISAGMAGFYRSGYGVDGQVRPLAITQFQESDARRAFPCVDHPRHKATFSIALVVAREQIAISNGAVIEETLLPDGRKKVVFADTPRMSTYLLFLGVGEFESVVDAEDSRVRLAAAPGVSRFGTLGLAFGRQSLQFCERYFDIPYPLDKMDLIAIPDFAFGAMENWGAITFRENLLLDYPETTSQEGRERICEVIAHEVTHQWFGNLVTPEDWRFLWLNESFATYFGYGIVDHYYPEWGIWEKFVLGQTNGALERDALLETLPIEIPGGEHMVINTATAPIIYSKGGSILRQIRDYIGDQSFQSGLQHYLRSHAYDCAGSREFWAAFETVADAPVSDIMRAWVEQPGHPMVTVEHRDGQLQLTQQRFSFQPHTDESLWPIPVSLRLFEPDGTQRRQRILLKEARQSIAIGASCVVKVNDGQAGFYRVAYADPVQRAALGPLVRGGILSPIDRWGLQNDLFAMVRAGRESLGVYLKFLNWYDREEAFMPLASIDQHLRYAHLVAGGGRGGRLAEAGRDLTSRVLAAIGFAPVQDEPHAIAAVRDQFIFSAVVYGAEEAAVFVQAAAGRSDLHPDILKGVWQADAFLNGGEALARMIDRLEASASEHERLVLLAAMGCFRDPAVLAQARDYVLANVPDRNRFIPLAAMGSNPYAVGDLWEWFVNAQAQLADFHPLLRERVIAAVIPVAGMNNPDAVQAFFDAYLADYPQAGDVVRLSLEKLAINLKFAAAVAALP